MAKRTKEGRQTGRQAGKSTVRLEYVSPGGRFRKFRTRRCALLSPPLPSALLPCICPILVFFTLALALLFALRWVCVAHSRCQYSSIPRRARGTLGTTSLRDWHGRVVLALSRKSAFQFTNCKIFRNYEIDRRAHVYVYARPLLSIHGREPQSSAISFAFRSAWVTPGLWNAKTNAAGCNLLASESIQTCIF